MKIYIDLLFINMKIETYSIEVEKNTSLKQAKELLQKTSYVYPEEQMWFCDNNNMVEQKCMDWNTTSRYSIIVNNKWYNFNIKTITNLSISIDHLTSRDQISTIKYHIYEKVKLSPESYKLTYIKKNEVKELRDNDVIGQYFIPNESTINLVIKLNSGLK